MLNRFLILCLVALVYCGVMAVADSVASRVAGLLP